MNSTRGRRDVFNVHLFSNWVGCSSQWAINMDNCIQKVVLKYGKNRFLAGFTRRPGVKRQIVERSQEWLACSWQREQCLEGKLFAASFGSLSFHVRLFHDLNHASSCSSQSITLWIQGIDILQIWHGKRYMNAAFPHAFVRESFFMNSTLWPVMWVCVSLERISMVSCVALQLTTYPTFKCNLN